MSDLKKFQELVEKRRTVYRLNDELPVDKTQIEEVVKHAILHTPSAFNSQSTRVVMLFGADHRKLWDMIEHKLREMIQDDEAFKSTKSRIEGFKAGAGSILFYEDQGVVKELQERFSIYAPMFPTWSNQTSAMNQFVVWTALAAVDVGASIQHYIGLIDDEIADTWGIHKEWQLIAEMVYGGIVEPAGEKSFNPVDERLKVV